MQLRSSSSSSSRDEHHRSINMINSAQRRRSGDDDACGLPVYHHRSATARRDLPRTRSSSARWIHAIPVIVLLCLFSLWWFSFPVDVDIKDGRIAAIRPLGPPLLQNDTRIDLTILAAAAASPIPPFPLNLSGVEEEDQTNLRPASSPI